MYDHTEFLCLQITVPEIRPQVKWAVNLVIAVMVISIFHRGLCGYLWVNMLTLLPHGFDAIFFICPGLLLLMIVLVCVYKNAADRSPWQ